MIICKEKCKKDDLRCCDGGGYTLIEVVVVMMITAVTFVAIYALFAKSMKYDTEGRYEIVAAGLLQEAMEMIKNKKEHNELMVAIWNPKVSSTSPEVFDDINSLNGCNPSLSFEDGDGDGEVNYEFSCDSTSTTMQFDKDQKKFVAGCSGNCVGVEFDRQCESGLKDEDNDGNNDYLLVTCTVKWDSPLLNGQERTKSAELILTDWEE